MSVSHLLQKRSQFKFKKIRDISDVRDETDLNGLKIALDIKRNADPDTLMNKLYKLTPLRTVSAATSTY